MKEFIYQGKASKAKEKTYKGETEKLYIITLLCQRKYVEMSDKAHRGRTMKSLICHGKESLCIMRPLVT